MTVQVPAPVPARLGRSNQIGSARADSEEFWSPGAPRTPAPSTEMERQTSETRAQSGAGAHYPHLLIPCTEPSFHPRTPARVRNSSDHCTVMSLATQPFNHRIEKKTTGSVGSRGESTGTQEVIQRASPALVGPERGSLNLPFHLSNL